MGTVNYLRRFYFMENTNTVSKTLTEIKVGNEIKEKWRTFLKEIKIFWISSVLPFKNSLTTYCLQQTFRLRSVRLSLLS